LTLERERISDARPLGKLRADWPVLKPVLIFHLITRAVVITGLAVAAVISGRAFPDVVTRWDGRWYLKLAVHGYPSPLPINPLTGRIATNTAGFFPLYPALTKGLTSLGMPFWLGAMIINLVASTAAVLIIVLVGLQYLDHRPAQLMACLWTAFPVSAVLTTAYTESIFTLFGAASLLFALRHKWLLAGLAAALAGAVRAPGIVFAGAVGLAALDAIIRRREWRSLIGAVIGPLGFLAAVGYIGLRTGRMDAWTVTEHDGWSTRLTFGTHWLTLLTQSPHNPHGVPHLFTAYLAMALIALTIAAILLRPPLPIIGLLVAGAFLAFAFGGVIQDSAPRVMMTFFPVLAPLAILMSRWPAGLRWAFLGAGSVLAAVVGGYYFAFAPISP
jgi:hypothetical protein